MKNAPIQDQWEDLTKEWLDFLRVEHGCGANTLGAYRRDVTRYAADMSAHQVAPDQVASTMIEQHLQDLSSGVLTGKPLATTSIARALASIRGLHLYALKEHVLSSDPAAHVRGPKTGEHLPKALSVDQVERLLNAAHRGEDAASVRDAAFLEFLYATGARVSEACDVAADDMDLDGDLPVVRLFGKGRKERLVPIGGPAVRAMQAYMVRARPLLCALGQGDTHIFLNLRGQALSRQSAWGIIQKAAEAAKLGVHVTPHTLRHSFATHLLQGGASIRDVQEFLGHASVQTTQIYTKLSPQTLIEVYRTSHPRALHSMPGQNALGLGRGT